MPHSGHCRQLSMFSGGGTPCELVKEFLETSLGSPICIDCICRALDLSKAQKYVQTDPMRSANPNRQYLE